MSRTRPMAIVVAMLLAAAGPSAANNLALTNVTIKPWNDSTAYVQFDIRWDNSWRHTNINHDAAWMFFKIKPEGRTAWEHVILETNGHVVGTGTAVEIVVPSDRVGCFIRRAGEGSGALSVTNVNVAWNFASNSLVKTDRVRLQACALEMVYVAEGSFQVGDGTILSIQGQFEAGTNGTPFAITNEVYAIALGGGAAGSLGNNNASGMGVADDFNDATSQTLPTTFPKGYAAFYGMKYEITQGQYRDFLNTLTRMQQNTRTRNQAGNCFSMYTWPDMTDRNGIRCPTTVPLPPGTIVFGCDWNNNKIFNETNDAMDRACNYLLWADGCAFADWSGLRPMTELEFEKACRGPQTPVANEYAWGDVVIAAATGQLRNDGTGAESVTNNGNCNTTESALAGPYRVGIYATTNSTRQMAGASYYGIMELSGNVLEQPVTLGSAAGRTYTGQHGDGQLTQQGNASVTGWPATGGYRGGGNWGTNIDARVSDRRNAPRADAYGTHDAGWRGVRTAPAGAGP